MQNYVPRLLDAAKQNAGLASDYQLAQALDVAVSTISRWRDGTRLPVYRYITKLATLAGVAAEPVVLMLETIRETRRGKKAWIKARPKHLRREAGHQHRLDLGEAIPYVGAPGTKPFGKGRH